MFVTTSGEAAAEHRVPAGPGGEQGDDPRQVPQHPQEEEQLLMSSSPVKERRGQTEASG